ncbi:MAG: uroporphyrinogen-III C-methyltransferase [Candidatus Thiodiazotropha sp.]
MSDKEHQSDADIAGGEADFEDAIEGEVVSESGQRRTLNRLPLILAALALLAVAAGLLFGYRYWSEMKQTLAGLDSALQRANQEQTRLAGELRQAQQAAQTQQQEIEAQKTALAEQHKRLLEAREASQKTGDQLYHSLQEIQTRLGGKESRWRAAEAEYLLRVANHRLTLMGDPTTALEALKSADERLGATGDPGWAPVREMIAREITQLKALPTVDQAGISAELAALSSQVDKLPLQDEGVSLAGHGEGSTAAPAASAADDGFSLTRVLDDFWQGFKSMMVIRHHDRPVSAMLPPEQRYFLIQNLRLKLEAAKAALMGRNQTLYADNLNSAADWVATYFEAGDPAVTGFRSQIEALAKRQIAPALPDISASLRALQERRRALSEGADR